MGWKYHVYTPGQFIYLDIYNKEDRDNYGSYTLISKTRVQADSAGLQEYALPENEQIQVHPWYVVGYHYDKGHKGVMAEVRSGQIMDDMPYSVGELSNIYSEKIKDDEIPLGKVFAPATKQSDKGLPLFMPLIKSEYYSILLLFFEKSMA